MPDNNHYIPSGASVMESEGRIVWAATTHGGSYTARARATYTPVTALTVAENYSFEDAVLVNPSDTNLISAKGSKQKNMKHDVLVFFRYAKSRFGLIEEYKLKEKLTELEKAIEAAYSNGQLRLGKKFENEWIAKMREAEIYAKGISKYFERSRLDKIRHRIRTPRGKKISDTLIKDYTRVIPKKVMRKVKDLRDVFDDFVIWHYWDDNAKDVKDMTPEEKEIMKDPIIFGIIKETDKLYFIADWDDEYCDLSFDDLIDVVKAEAL